MGLTDPQGLKIEKLYCRQKVFGLALKNFSKVLVDNFTNCRIETMNVLGREFYQRSAVEVARSLLGKTLVRRAGLQGPK